MSKDIVFSGVQPTGEIHLGNYLGAIKQFLNFQNDCDSIFCIVDQHSITIFQDPNELKEIFEEIFVVQKKRIYNALLSSSSEEVINFDSVLKKIING